MTFFIAVLVELYKTNEVKSWFNNLFLFFIEIEFEYMI